MNERIFTLDEYEDVKLRAYKEGYNVAIRVAAWAIEELPCKCNDMADYCDGQTDAITAINELRKEQP